MQIRELDPGSRGAWNAFVEAQPGDHFFHLAEWADVLRSAFRFPTHYLYAEQDGAIVGVLPLAHVRSWLFGNSLCSTPYCVYGGVLSVLPEATAALEAHGAKLAEKLKVDALELRNTEVTQPEWPTSDLYVTFCKSISADEETNLKAIPRKQRAMVRKGIQAGLVAEEQDGVGEFFRVFATSVRNLGTPVFPQRYFRLLKERFGQRCSVLTVKDGDTPVSSVMSFHGRDTIFPYYGGGTPRARETKAFDFMYWNLMCRAAARGYTEFDYGRSKLDSGNYSFKKNWGFEPTPLFYQYHLVAASEPPQRNPNNPKLQLLIELWKKLPLPVANALGPVVSRSLG